MTRGRRRSTSCWEQGGAFDMVTRPLTIAGRRARLWVVNGYRRGRALLERAISAWRPIVSLADTPDLQAFLERYVSVCDAAVERDRLTAVTAVLRARLSSSSTATRAGCSWTPSSSRCARSRSQTRARCCAAATTASSRAS